MRHTKAKEEAMVSWRCYFFQQQQLRSKILSLILYLPTCVLSCAHPMQIQCQSDNYIVGNEAEFGFVLEMPQGEEMEQFDTYPRS